MFSFFSIVVVLPIVVCVNVWAVCCVFIDRACGFTNEKKDNSQCEFIRVPQCRCTFYIYLLCHTDLTFNRYGISSVVARTIERDLCDSHTHTHTHTLQCDLFILFVTSLQSSNNEEEEEKEKKRFIVLACIHVKRKCAQQRKTHNTVKEKCFFSCYDKCTQMR